RRVALRGHIHPKARVEDDQGPVASTMALPHVSIVLKRTASQEAELTQLLAEQQDSASANYHHWLTPEQFADRFGVSQDDLDKLVAWLKEQDFTIVSVA